MPYRNVERARAIKYPDLVRPLAAELKREGQGGDPRQVPVILFERARGESLHIYVVWDGWSDLDRTERSEVIMDAMEQARPEELLSVTVAAGLTQQEADRMRIQYH